MVADFMKILGLPCNICYLSVPTLLLCSYIKSVNNCLKWCSFCTIGLYVKCFFILAVQWALSCHSWKLIYFLTFIDVLVETGPMMKSNWHVTRLVFWQELSPARCPPLVPGLGLCCFFTHAVTWQSQGSHTLKDLYSTFFHI